MKIIRVDRAALLVYENGEYNNPFEEGCPFDEIEAEFLNAYDALFKAVGNVVRLKESGTAPEADVAMSKWVDPTRVIPLVIKRLDESSEKIIPTINKVLRKHPKYAAILFPEAGEIVVQGDGCILVSTDTPTEISLCLGIKE